MGWYYQFYSRRLLPPTLGFATLFFAIFLLAPLFAAGGDNAGDRRLQRTLPALAVLNGAVYFLQLYSLLEAVDRWELAWAAVAVAAVYLALGRVQRVWNSNAVQGLDSVHFMLAVAFVTLAIPFGFAGHWITFGWLVEAAILLWILHRVGSRLQRNLAGAVLILAILRLLLYDNLPVSVPIFNARFGLYLAAIATLALGGTLARRQRLQFPVRGDLDRVEQLIPAVAMVLLNVLALIALNLEVHDYFRRSAETVLHARVSALPGVEARQLLIARDFAYSAVCMVYGAVLMWAGFAKRSAFLRWQALVLMAVTIAKVFTYDVSELDHGYRIASFVALGGLLLAVSFLYQRDWLQLSGRRKA